MSIEEAKRRIFLIKRELLLIYKNNINVDQNNIDKLIQIDKEIHRLYNEYLKIYVQASKMIPEFNINWLSIHCSCYYYSLNIQIPSIFEKVYEELTGYYFESPLGSVANLPYLEKFTKKDVLDYLYKDLDALNISYYPSSIEDSPKYGGYKIVLLVDENPLDPDYHFVRQNKDGLWSEKDGCGSEIVNLTSEEEFMNDPAYKYVTTLELVKPTIKR